MLKKMLAIALSLALAATTLPMTVYAADVSGEESHTEELAQDIIEQDDGSDPFDFVEGDSEEATRETIPDKFDLSGKFIDDGDNTPYVTPVRFQNHFGSLSASLPETGWSKAPATQEAETMRPVCHDEKPSARR